APASASGSRAAGKPGTSAPAIRAPRSVGRNGADGGIVNRRGAGIAMGDYRAWRPRTHDAGAFNTSGAPSWPHAAVRRIALMVTSPAVLTFPAPILISMR